MDARRSWRRAGRSVSGRLLFGRFAAGACHGPTRAAALRLGDIGAVLDLIDLAVLEVLSPQFLIVRVAFVKKPLRLARLGTGEGVGGDERQCDGGIGVADHT